MAKEVTKFHNAIWGVRVCLNMCVWMCKVSYRILSFWEGGELQSVDVEEVHSTYQLGVSGCMLPQFFCCFFNSCSEIDSGVFWDY